MSDEKSGVTEIVAATPIKFEVDGITFAIRPPEPEEYDDADFIYNTEYATAITDPNIARLKSKPCSDGARTMLETLADLSEKLAKKAGVRSEQAKALLRRATNYRETAKTRTYAEELAHDRALLIRDRWLTQRLLCTEDGQPFFDTQAKDFASKWAAPGLLKIKEAARQPIWQAFAQVENAPFVSGQPPVPG